MKQLILQLKKQHSNP